MPLLHLQHERCEQLVCTEQLTLHSSPHRNSSRLTLAVGSGTQFSKNYQGQE